MSDRKHTRNKDKCNAYRAKDKRQRNKLARMLKRINSFKRHNDNYAIHPVAGIVRADRSYSVKGLREKNLREPNGYYIDSE